jgi:hypothetical protein
MDFPPFVIVYHKRTKSPIHAEPKHNLVPESPASIIPLRINFLFEQLKQLFFGILFENGHYQIR